jgi:hypothetical protein
MSRTYKDVPYKFRHSDETFEVTHDRLTVPMPYWYDPSKTFEMIVYLKKPGVLKKKKKHVDTEDHWMHTPNFWVHDYMTVPQRAAGKMWEKKAARTRFEDLDDLDKPSVGRKPHIYYW